MTETPDIYFARKEPIYSVSDEPLAASPEDDNPEHLIGEEVDDSDVWSDEDDGRGRE